MKKILFILVIFNFQLSIFNSLQAQANRHQLRDGNRNYKNERYDKAEVDYRRALESDSLDYRGQYNLANSLYRQKKYDEAVRHYDQALQLPELSDQQRWQSLHNKGNAYLKAGMEDQQQGMKMFQQAVQSYQDALKVDPKNDDTRYNLAYARRLLQQAQQQQQQQQQQQSQQNQDQQNKDQQQQNQQNQNQQNQQDQQNKDNQQNQQQQNPQGDGKEEQQKKQNKRPNPMEQRKQDAERMLEAVKNNEKQSLKDQTKKMQVGTVKHSDKDW